MQGKCLPLSDIPSTRKCFLYVPGQKLSGNKEGEAGEMALLCIECLLLSGRTEVWFQHPHGSSPPNPSPNSVVTRDQAFKRMSLWGHSHSNHILWLLGMHTQDFTVEQTILSPADSFPSPTIFLKNYFISFFKMKGIPDWTCPRLPRLPSPNVGFTSMHYHTAWFYEAQGWNQGFLVPMYQTSTLPTELHIQPNIVS